MKAKVTKTVIFCILFLSMASLYAQELKNFTHNSLAEKIYLQLDSEVYTTDKTIWFKAVLVNAASHSLEVSSGVLYVDLISFEEKIVESKILKIRNGIGHGFFDLDRSYPEGIYQIRAYTEWNKNFENDFVFEKYIKIFSEIKKKNTVNPIDNIRLTNSTATQNSFKIDFYPKAIDAYHRKSLKLIVIIDGKRETIYLDQSDDDSYTLDLSTPKTAEAVKIRLVTTSGKTYSKEFALNLDYVDVQFFPEGGKLVSGLASKVGFKALDAHGKAKVVEGDILNKDGQVITSFKSNTLGMGHFILDDIDANQSYKARLKNIQKTIDLPKVEATGFGLRVEPVKSLIAVGIASNNQKNTKIKLKGSVRGVEFYNEESALIDGKFIYSIPKDIFPEGVIIFTLFDDNDAPIAERLFFNERKDSRVEIDVLTNKRVYSKRDEVVLDIKTKVLDSISVQSNTSVLVLDKNRIEDGFDDTLLSHFLLSSDIKGKIESPASYFHPNPKLNIDDLMLTQGWRNYKYTAPSSKFNYSLEKGLNVSGVVNVSNHQLKDDKMDFAVMFFDDEKSTYNTQFEVPGSFNIDLKDMFGDNIDILIQPTGKTEKEWEDFSISLNRKVPLDINFSEQNKFLDKDSIENTIINANVLQNQMERDYYSEMSGIIRLNEVVIEGYKMTPVRKEMFDKYGAPDVVIDGREILEKEKEMGWSNGLMSVLNYNFRDKVFMRSSQGNFRARSVKDGPGYSTFYVVDGKPVFNYEYDVMQFIDAKEVTSFEIIEFAENIKEIYSLVNLNVPPPRFLNGAVIAIYTRAGEGLHGALLRSKKAIGLNSIPVFSFEKEFYTPNHDSGVSTYSSKPELRSTIYWNPDVTTTKEGTSSVKYYHSDNEGDFVVIIQSITKDGRIGYKTINYTVSETTN